MLRPALMAATLFGAAVALSPGARADAALPDGNWVLSLGGPLGEQNLCIIKVETKDGRPTVSVPFSRPKSEVMVSNLKVTDQEVSFTMTQMLVVTDKDGKERKLPGGARDFVGTRGKDPKVVLGSVGPGTPPSRARLTATDKQMLGPDELVSRVPEADLMQKAQELTIRPLQLQAQARQEKDAAKKKELTEQAAEARKEADEKIPPLYRVVVEKAADNPIAIDAALSLLTGGAKYKVTADEAAKLAAVIRKQAEPFGPRYLRGVSLRAAEALVTQKGLEAAALPLVEPLAQGLTDKDAPATQVGILTTYRAALAAAGKADQAKAVEGRIAKIETKLDEEYLAKVPPFKPEPYAGRKEKGANQVAVLELFTGAECPPCVAADVAFDALGKSYKPTDLVLIQYHMHIPGPDPMTNPDTVARWDYYRETFPMEIRGTPSTVFNGKAVDLRGGGPMANAENKYKEYRGVVDPLLEKTTPVKLAGKAARSGDQVRISVEVDGLESADDLRLRLLVVEDVVKFVGGNQLRFHHHVVRSMPGGPQGVAVKDRSMKHTATADLAEVRRGLTKYLDEFAANERPFPRAGRPMEMKEVKVIALVQNDKTREILQAVQIEVEGKPAGGGQ